MNPKSKKCCTKKKTAFVKFLKRALKIYQYFKKGKILITFYCLYCAQGCGYNGCNKMENFQRYYRKKAFGFYAALLIL